MTDTAVDFLLENLKQLIACEEIVSELSLVQNDQINSLYEEFGFLRKFLKDVEGKRREHEEVKSLVARIGDVTYEAEETIDLFMVRFLHMQEKSMAEPEMHQAEGAADSLIVFLCMREKSIAEPEMHPKREKNAEIVKILMLDHAMKEIKSIKKEVKKIYDKKLYGTGLEVPQVRMSSHGSSSRISAPNAEEETVIGFDKEAEMIKERLLNNDVRKQLEVISIVGMPGLGKTTLARKVYNDLLIQHHFYIRGWTYVSQVPRKRDLLLSILRPVVEHKDVIYTLSYEKLGEQLYKGLSGRRYLIVIDDIWHSQIWIDLKKYFPDNRNGSRIIFTSRITDMALHEHDKSDSRHFLKFLTEDESWDLLQQKVFGKKSCSPNLVEIGKQIAVKCGGLPLAIVVVAGLLVKIDGTQDWWKQVSESVSSYILSDTEQCMDTLALSYNHLPHHLKSCFLYFGAFPEDYEIPVRKLIWLWIAEGFIQQTGNNNLEDLAEKYLMDLIDRSLVLVAKRRSTGGIKACRVHDLLHDFCLRKAKEENFLQQIFVHEDFPPRPGSILIARKQRRLCLNSRVFDYISLAHSGAHIRSLLCFASEHGPSSSCHMLIYQIFKLLRVLDLSAISMSANFPNELLQLVLLRYLALQGENLILPSSISDLRNLEILIVSQGTGTILPLNIWKMVKLRHLCIAGENHISPYSEDGYPSMLNNLKTLSQVCPSKSCLHLLEMAPNLRKLAFRGDLVSGPGKFWFPDLNFLNHLETLKFFNTASLNKAFNNDMFSNIDSPPRVRWNLAKYPPNLKRLTLSSTFLEWREMSTVGMLPNLEVLKLEFQAFIGPLWETNDGEFCKLRFLRLCYMHMEQWDTCSIHLPSLQRLELHRCVKLKEIPSELVYISTLHTIEVTQCSHSAANSARKIQEEQQSMGNDWLKILVYPEFC